MPARVSPQREGLGMQGPGLFARQLRVHPGALPGERFGSGEQPRFGFGVRRVAAVLFGRQKKGQRIRCVCVCVWSVWFCSLLVGGCNKQLFATKGSKDTHSPNLGNLAKKGGSNATGFCLLLSGVSPQLKAVGSPRKALG